jgi:hypothetical protein
MTVVNVLRRKRLISTVSDTTVPRTYGIILFRMFDMLDVYGPLEILQLIGGSQQTNIAHFAETLELVTTRPEMGTPQYIHLLRPHTRSRQHRTWTFYPRA